MSKANKQQQKTVTIDLQVDLDADKLERFKKLGLTKKATRYYISRCVNDSIDNIVKDPELLGWYVKHAPDYAPDPLPPQIKTEAKLNLTKAEYKALAAIAEHEQESIDEVVSDILHRSIYGEVEITFAPASKKSQQLRTMLMEDFRRVVAEKR